jgi:hypothetical protein
MGLIETVWDMLGKKFCLIFGKECASACVWMLFSLFLRTVLIAIRLEHFVPCGMVFAFPYFIQLLGNYVPLIHDIFPILPNRLTDSILGRISPTRLFLVIPAHFLGCVIGTVLFKTLCPIAPNSVFEPISYDSNVWFQAVMIEAFVMCAYICTIIAVPELLEVNRLPAYLVSVPISLLMLVKVPNRGSIFNPAALYALWYVNGQFSGNWKFQGEHIIGLILGAVAAGIICAKLFPDDPGSWRKSRVGLQLL